jgi:hypothetical protein
VPCKGTNAGSDRHLNHSVSRSNILTKTRFKYLAAKVRHKVLQQRKVERRTLQIRFTVGPIFTVSLPFFIEATHGPSQSLQPVSKNAPLHAMLVPRRRGSIAFTHS